jgi:murein DD-endopeptidase MepM/ murein hydrolase activator NlpD
MQPPREDGPGAVESPPEHDPSAFDPGVETGYLRRGPRDQPPDVELGARPFDPGEEVGFDDRRAKRRRRRPVRPMPPPGAESKAESRGRPAPAARSTAPGLARPTAKLGGTAAAVTAAALLLGSLIGLPTPFSESTGGVASLNAQGIPVGSGTAAALYRGPFHPVRGEFDYGERGAEFGADRGGRKHEGQDIFAKKETPLVAVRDGVVVDRAKASGNYSGGRGNYVVVYSPLEHRSYVYMHLLRPPVVDKGARVHAGELLGLMGCSGSCFGTHLHFEVRRGRASFAADTKAIDPAPFLQNLPQAPEELAED